jgi:tRNA A-37 threonylcarbamoyl transferase component Bud32/predicted transcriptional regulator
LPPGSSYVVGQWVRGPSFYGRDDVIEEVLHGNRNSLWVVATRRSGKTSLLREVERRAWEEATYFPLFLDLQGSETPDDLNRELEDALFDIEERLEQAGIDRSGLIGVDLFASLGSIRRRCRQVGRRLLVLIDESEALLGIRDHDPKFLNRLRHFLQSKEDVRSVLTSTIRLAALADARGDTSPFLHGFTPPIYLRGLDPGAALELIRQEKQPAALRPDFDPVLAETIRERCDHHPYLLQLVCKRTTELGDADEAMTAVATDPMVRYFFSVDFDMLSPREREVIEVLAATSPAHSGSIAERLPVDSDDTAAALRQLENLGYVRRDRDGRFVLANVFFRQWLQGQRGPGSATKEQTPSPRGTAAKAYPLAGGKLGKYELIEQIARGGFAVVYKARDPDLDRTVAVKACIEDDEALRARFAREARIVARLDHPNIVTVHDFGFQGEVTFLVQEYLAGEDLRQIIRRGPLAVPRAAALLLQVAMGMDYAHRNAVIHRDLKPGNIMVLPGGRTKILDFGLAKARGDETLTGDSVALGTVAYLAPETLGQRPADARSDVFSFGVLGYELLSARRPFVGDSLAALMMATLKRRPVPLRELVPECPGQLERLLMSCLEKEPAKRPQEFQAIVVTLTETLGSIADLPEASAMNP